MLSSERKRQLVTDFVENKTGPIDNATVYLLAREELEDFITQESMDALKNFINATLDVYGVDRKGLARIRDFFASLRALNQEEINNIKSSHSA